MEHHDMVTWIVKVKFLFVQNPNLLYEKQTPNYQHNFSEWQW